MKSHVAKEKLDLNNQDELYFEKTTFALHQKENRTHECDGFAATDDIHQANDIIIIENLTRRIIGSEEIIFSVEEKEKFRINKPNEKYKHILCKDRFIIDGIKRYYQRYEIHSVYDPIKSTFSIHKLNPYVELFLEQLKDKLVDKIKLPAISFFDLYHNCKSEKQLQDTVELLNNFIEGIRSGAKSKVFKAVIYEHQRLLKKNHQSLMKYINKLFEHHSRLLVLRVDFGYQKDSQCPMRNQAEIYQQYQQVKRDREHLFNNRRSNKGLFAHLKGYVWKLEFAQSKGFHYHCLFFFDGSAVRQDVTLARMIGEYWAKVITKGRGIYFNCNAKKHDYKQLGIGMINHDETELRQGLEKAASYLTKTDYYARIVITDNRGKTGRTFGKGEITKPKEIRGRPRKNVKVKQLSDE